MGKPVACIGDMHTCPVTAPIAHVGGPITGPGASTVWIEGRPAAILGDSCACAAGIDRVITGSSGVFIEGKPAVRVEDRCAHGGVIVTGCATVLIGDVIIGDAVAGIAYEKRDEDKGEKPFHKPPPEKRRQMIRQAIGDAMEMLKRKLRLLKKKDADTMVLFRKWFGRDDEKARRIIVGRISKELKVLRTLTESNFIEIKDMDTRQKSYALVIPDDISHTIMLGHPFWEAPANGNDSKAGILVHEISHFKDIEGTKDYEYGDFNCLRLAKFNPDRALFNADNFERFIESC